MKLVVTYRVYLWVPFSSENKLLLLNQTSLTNWYFKLR